MSTPIQMTVEVLGAASVKADLAAIGENRRSAVRDAVKGWGIRVVNHVKRNKLTGQVLRVRTGRLRSSINERLTESGNTITSTIGTAVGYGADWERGFAGTFAVRAHIRRIKSRSSHRTEWILQSYNDAKRRRVETATGIAFVSAHDRTVAQAPRPFLRPSLAELRPQILAGLARAVQRGTR